MKFLDRSKDLEKDRARYNRAASLENSVAMHSSGEGFSHFPAEYIPPFETYYSYIKEELVNVKDVLEIGAGVGQHTRPVVTPFTNVTALDISEVSLEKLQSKFEKGVKTVVGNIEDLPFPDKSFDLVISCGILSFGDPSKVDREILRVLRPGGTFIFMDSLNHNPIFKLNRYTRFLKGSRSLSSVIRIPKMKRLSTMSSSFQYSRLSRFGTWIWAFKILNTFFEPCVSLKIYNFLENLTGDSRYAFKIVGMLKGRKL